MKMRMKQNWNNDNTFRRARILCGDKKLMMQIQISAGRSDKQRAGFSAGDSIVLDFDTMSTLLVGI
jgi:hypothetical protein